MEKTNVSVLQRRAPPIDAQADTSPGWKDTFLCMSHAPFCPQAMTPG